jgi:hypothetical protein
VDDRPQETPRASRLRGCFAIEIHLSEKETFFGKI